MKKLLLLIALLSTSGCMSTVQEFTCDRYGCYQVKEFICNGLCNGFQINSTTEVSKNFYEDIGE